MIGRGRIQFLAEGMTSDIQRELIVSPSLNPLAGGRDGGTLSNPFE
jgi:hypothetical protein